MGLVRRRPFALMIAALICVPLGVVLMTIGLAVADSVRHVDDASRWRDAAAQRASSALRRPAVRQGAVELEPKLGRELGLRIGSLRILNPPGSRGRRRSTAHHRIFQVPYVP